MVIRLPEVDAGPATDGSLRPWLRRSRSPVPVPRAHGTASPHHGRRERHGQGRRAQSRRRGTVLVCDDDASLLRALTISLTARGYEVVVARSGEEGLDVPPTVTPTWSCWTSASPVSTESRSSGHPGVEQGPHRRALRPPPEREQGGGARCRSRRLRDQAVRDGRAAGPAPGHPPPDRTRRSSSPGGDRGVHHRPGRASGSPGTARTSISPRRSGTSSRSWSAIPAGWCPSASSSTRSGAPTTRPRPSTCGS